MKRLAIIGGTIGIALVVLVVVISLWSGNGFKIEAPGVSVSTEGDTVETLQQSEKLLETVVVKISTGSSNNAGTNARVFLQFCGREFQIDSPVKHNDFEANDTRDYSIPVQSFNFTEDDIKSHSIRLRHDNTGSEEPSWQVRNLAIKYKFVGESPMHILFSEGVGWLKEEAGYALYKEWPPITQ